MSRIPRLSAVRTTLKLLGSLQLAMILLAVIIVACAVGTVAESRLDTAVAQAYVYDAPWFFAWLLLLCVNLTAAVLARYPWKARQTGLIVTHAGIVVLLMGAMIGRKWGMEGSVTLFKGAAPKYQLVLNQTTFEARPAQASESVSRTLNLEVFPPSAKRPVHIKAGGLRISAVDYAKELGTQTKVEKAATNGLAAVRVVLRSKMVPQPINQWLWLGDPMRTTFNLGQAQVRFAAGDPNAPGAPLAVASASGHDAHATHATHAVSAHSASEALREKHFVFAKLPDMSMARRVSGPPTGVKATYRFDPSATATNEAQGRLELKFNDQRFEFLVTQIVGQSVPLVGTDWKLDGLKFLPDFRLEGKEAVTASEQPNNPALVFEISGSAAASSSSEDCDHAEGECNHEEQKACCPKPGEPKASPHATPASPFKSGLTLFVAPDNRLHFATSSDGQRTGGGEVEIGKGIPLGSADWQVEVAEWVEHAVIKEELLPATQAGLQPIGAPGLLVQASKEGQLAQQWIASGTPADLSVAGESVRVSFGQRLQPIEFGLVLDDFEVDRDEGTMNPAGFKSHVRFVDPVSKQELRREVWMNNPADYPNFPGVGLLGTAYKFSQASWNPNNLNQTTLQVVRDPGWSLKWIGSLLLCGGLVIMFYFKPNPHGAVRM